MFFLERKFGKELLKKIIPTCRTLFADITKGELNTPLVPLRNRMFLPGSASANMPEYLSDKAHENMKIVKWNTIRSMNQEGIIDLAGDVRSFLDDNIGTFPAILIKGLPITSVENFSQFTETIGYKKMTYAGGSAFREKFSGNVYAASDEIMEFTIEPHNEMSYLRTSPSRVG